MQAYSDPKREQDEYALDIETFFIDRAAAVDQCLDAGTHEATSCKFCQVCEYSIYGWYWQACFPGCLPDGDPIGPFDTQEEALADAQEGAGE